MHEGTITVLITPLTRDQNLGNAMLALKTANMYGGLEDLRTWFKNSLSYAEPDEKAAPLYESKFGIFMNYIESLKALDRSSIA